MTRGILTPASVWVRECIPVRSSFWLRDLYDITEFYNLDIKRAVTYLYRKGALVRIGAGVYKRKQHD